MQDGVVDAGGVVRKSVFDRPDLLGHEPPDQSTQGNELVG
jgi:hypothetical protein